MTEAIAAGGELAALIDAPRARQTRQNQLRQMIATEHVQTTRIDRRAVERRVRERLTVWRAMLTGSVEDGRRLFREVLRGPIRFTPEPDAREYHFSGEADLGQLFSGIAGVAPYVASPTGFEAFPRLESRLLVSAA